MWFESVFLTLGIPVGYYIAWLAYDELVSGRKYLLTLMGVSFLLGILFGVFSLDASMWTGFFIAIIAGIGVMKSYDSSWTRRKKTHKKPGNNERE